MQTSESAQARRPIRVLPREIAEKIAAGEVVERPGSVIKELVENALDAGATEIRVELDDGGRKRVRVADDGHGIAADEMPVALERHATSKIAELDDLWSLSTMGFRGEALPSIAAISRFTLESAMDGARGRRLYLEGGRVLRDEDTPSPGGPGTAVTVEDLFYNVPARLKFLRSKSGEQAHVRELLERIALCNPAVGFTLIADGRKTLRLEPTDGERRRVADVLETDAGNLEDFEARFEDIAVRGWLDRDGRAPNSRHVFLSVNGRMVRDKLLQQAVLVALRPRMMEGEYPRIFLAVDLPPGDVDVNVHPAKSEVRFRRSRDVFQLVHGALDRLAKEPTRPYYSAGLPAAAPQPALFAQDRASYRTKDYAAVNLNLGGLTIAPPAPEPVTGTGTVTATAPVTEYRVPGFSSLQYIGQLKNTYLLFQDGDGLVVIDQHAAHERVNYERFKADFARTGLTAQPLLVSAVVKCKPEDLALAQEHAGEFTRLGFEFEPFGDNCLLLRAAPEGMKPDRASDLFRSLLEELRDSDEAGAAAADPARLSAKLERMLATSACHGSVRAGQALSPHEARGLAAQLDETASSLNCPHGRPASVRLTYAQIEALFKR